MSGKTQKHTFQKQFFDVMAMEWIRERKKNEGMVAQAIPITKNNLFIQTMSSDGTIKLVFGDASLLDNRMSFNYKNLTASVFLFFHFRNLVE